MIGDECQEPWYWCHIDILNALFHHLNILCHSHVWKFNQKYIQTDNSYVDVQTSSCNKVTPWIFLHTSLLNGNSGSYKSIGCSVHLTKWKWIHNEFLWKLLICSWQSPRAALHNKFLTSFNHAPIPELKLLSDRAPLVIVIKTIAFSIF